ncbi:MAG: hypothetical protein CVV06_14980 [Gammaproteobacteria bacterium HGW-Gammaproteobacteria-10]|nr:MAG: hypothetical protein CVV06_14980 [Gammaproteobacteria bacterium HGW-Gammaproteobacteria-10]
MHSHAGAVGTRKKRPTRIPLFPKFLLGKYNPEAPASRDRTQPQINSGSLVRSFLIVGKLELAEQFAQAGAWATASTIDFPGDAAI